MKFTKNFSLIMLICCILSTTYAKDEESFETARKSAKIASYSLSKTHRWLHEVALKRIDPATGLYIADGKWNYRDTAADCYPFLTWAAFILDSEALNGPVRSILHAEQKLCNHVDRIPVSYDYKNKKKIDLSYDEMIFQASEYVKDGLIAIIEVTGKDEWFERMKGIEEDIWKHARYDSPYGKIPSKNVEVNGEQIQALVRLYTMTGQKKFLEWAERLADYYLLAGNFVPTRLRDHGCEIIGGLGLLLAVESQHNPKKAKIYQPLIKKMLDEILKRGTNEDGIMFDTLDKPDSRLSDGWGYNYVTYLCYDMVAARPVYRNRIVRTLANLKKSKYKNYRWEGDSIDGYADSIEGGLYIMNRYPVPEALAWADSEMAANVVYSDKPLATAPLWGTMKLQANGVRTTLIHALMHTRGLIARPWRKDLTLGASETKDGLAIVMRATENWKGRLVFDIPRHRKYMGFKHDWPRMNTMPEWFTVEPEKKYVVKNITNGTQKNYTGKQLHKGLPVELKAGEETLLLIK
ncbi:MAG: hypothetical protein FVQ84_09975 [Planctomycetes bacterium]|nr:hypothetical protein [Planctomycetota bacterium]